MSQTRVLSIDKIYFQCFRSLCKPLQQSEEHSTGTHRPSPMRAFFMQEPPSWKKYRHCPLTPTHDHHQRLTNTEPNLAN